MTAHAEARRYVALVLLVVAAIGVLLLGPALIDAVHQLHDVNEGMK